ncbi:heme ABC transporter ATP-binding protein [Phaeobacter porticola]|uniref:ABC-type hemin transport system, ATPase component n=1 Tax=Phaeobacter porticola TaxID=1844006 RepID=A0A1L3IAC1_9RHOB|nr:heme ABC transporter ATP-binding protein [Phaeobacter porticola]APG49077.1 ABC-type hemin transport system, ATPase component [Phaeobacter porticola]
MLTMFRTPVKQSDTARPITPVAGPWPISTLAATGLRVRLGQRDILQGVDFTARSGEVTAIAGPNGSGKTTLLRAITGEIPFEGHIFLNGHNTATMKPQELAAIRAVQPQSATIAFPFTVLEIVRLGLSAGLSAAQTELPLKALQAVDLANHANRFYQDLSGGEQQRVQLARVLTQVWQPVVDGQPRWLILDEPVASLDIGHQFTVMDLVRRYAEQGGGVVAVMHDLNLTAMFADQITLVHRGRIAAKGCPQEVLTDQTLRDVYDSPVPVNTLPPNDLPYLLPQARSQTTR